MNENILAGILVCLIVMFFANILTFAGLYSHIKDLEEQVKKTYNKSHENYCSVLRHLANIESKIDDMKKKKIKKSKLKVLHIICKDHKEYWYDNVIEIIEYDNILRLKHADQATTEIYISNILSYSIEQKEK